MLKKNTINILLSFDDKNWDYTRHVAVTILSILENNINNRIKIWIMSSNVSEENITELKRLVNLYNQEIEFIIRDDIISEDLKNIIINKNNLGRWAWYRLFFPKFIKWIDRILYMDCDVLVNWDISEIYNMDMKWKAIAWYLDMFPFRCKDKIFWVNNYINSWVLLFDTKKYDMWKISVKNMEYINKKYSKYFHWSDQDKINLIFKDDIVLWKKEMNYQITSKWFNKWLKNAKIIHCLLKPYVQYSLCPKILVNVYNSYLNLTKRKWFQEKKANFWYWKYIIISIRNFCFNLFVSILWDKLTYNVITLYRKLTKYY